LSCELGETREKRCFRFSLVNSEDSDWLAWLYPAYLCGCVNDFENGEGENIYFAKYLALCKRGLKNVPPSRSRVNGKNAKVCLKVKVVVLQARGLGVVLWQCSTLPPSRLECILH